MATRTKKVKVYNIVKTTDNAYEFTISSVNSSQKLKYNINKDMIGDILTEVIRKLNIDAGESLPGALTQFTATLTYVMLDEAIPVKIEVSTSVLGRVNEYISIVDGKEIGVSQVDTPYTLIRDIMPKNLEEYRYLKGYLVYAKDGDTIRIKVTEVNNVWTNEGQVVVGDDKVDIRLAGVDTRETHKDDASNEQKAQEVNIRWLASKGLYNSATKNEYLEKTFELGSEARRFVENTILNNEILILIDDYGDSKGLDSYGRLLGIVYVPNNEEDSLYDAINLNKSLLASKSTVFEGQTLAEHYYQVDEKGQVQSRFSIDSWVEYIPEFKEKIKERKTERKYKSTSLEEFLKAHNMKLDKNNVLVYNDSREIQVSIEEYIVKDKIDLWSIVTEFSDGIRYTTEKEIAKANGYPDNPDILDLKLQNGKLIGKTLKIPIYQKFGPENAADNSKESFLAAMHETNANNIPADSATEDYIASYYDDRDELDGINRHSMTIEEIDEFYESGFTRIGDCTFVIPPLSIKVETTSNSQRFQTIRSKSSIQTQTGNSTKIITMSLFFADEEQVNGKEYENPVPSLKDLPKDPYYRNGLRPLIAQFKKAPFLPIENSLLNDKFGIYAVALKDLQINTVPGFPGVMEATLVMLEFDHTVYMPQEEYFTSAFNWKLFRWYYQQAMQRSALLKGHTYLGKIDTLDNSISFELLKEEELAKRQQAIRQLDKKIDPVIYAKINTDKGTKNSKLIQDSEEIEKAKRQKEVFMEWCYKHPQDEYPLFYDSNGVFMGLISNPDSPEREKYLTALFELFSALYFKGERITNNKYDKGAPGYKKYFVNESGKAYFIPNNMGSIIRYMEEAVVYGFGATPITIRFNGQSVNIEQRRITARNYDLMYIHSNYLLPTLTDTSGGVYLLKIEADENKVLFDKEHKRGKLYQVRPNEDFVIAAKIERGKEQVAKAIKNYELEFETLNEVAHRTEADIATETFHINGEFYIENITATMSNNLIPIQLLGQECPTYQYLGSQDTFITLTIRALDEEVVKGFNDLMKKAQKLAREYRVGITSSVLSIKNNLFKLLGVRDVLIESISIETSPEDKESYLINITLTAFDKEQKLKEDLIQEDIGDFIDPEKYYEYSRKRRSDSNFEYAAVDFRLREIEVYPDLDLPTWDELNLDLPYLGIKDIDGEPFTYLPNPTGAKYLDPDFYIRAVDTQRNYIADMLRNDRPGLYLKDSYGFEALELGPSPNQVVMSRPNVEFSPETQEWINKYLDTVEMGVVGGPEDISLDTTGAYNKFQSNRLTLEKAMQLDRKNGIDPKLVEKSPESYPNAYTNNLYRASNRHITSTVGTRLTKVGPIRLDNLIKEPIGINTLIESRDKSKYKVYRGKFSEEEIQELITEKLQGKEFKNPSKLEVHREITRLVNIYFSKHPSDKSYIDRDIECDTYRYGQYRLSPPKITREKIQNVLLAMFDVNSKWEQFVETKDGMVPFIYNGNVGLTQININSGIFNSKDEILKAAFDWRYNLQKGIEYFAICFNRAIKEGNKDARNNPLDWAIILYENGKGSYSDIFKKLDVDENEYYLKVKNTLALSYGVSSSFSTATPDKFVNEELISKEDANEQLREMMTRNLRSVVTTKGGIKDDRVKAIYIDGEHLYRPKLKYSNLIENHAMNAIPIIVADPYRQFEKAEKMSSQLIKWDAYYNTNVGRITNDPRVKQYGMRDLAGPLESMVYGHLKRRFDKSNKKLFDPFDYSRFYVVIKPDACNVLLKISEKIRSQSKYNADYLNDPRVTKYIPDMNKWEDIPWDDIYYLVDIDDFDLAKDLRVQIKTAETMSHFLVDPNEMPKTFRASFDDILQYDQRGRLIRAFPTFQMFLIHEGRWMAWHKLWDRFYGYNSIISIDIMKDRRIAADTAIITMSNIYHNLNTEDRDKSFGEWDLNLFDLFSRDKKERMKVLRTMFNLPDEEIIAAYKEKVDSLVLKPGARIHLRLGYGANAYALPVVFNGTITEMNAEEVVTVVAQGDGIELTNKLNVDPDTTTDPGLFGGIKEPREMICELLTSRGGFFKNLVNIITNKVFFNTHPLGIMHFGNQDVPKSLLMSPFNIFDIMNPDYGEAGINVYSAAGYNTFSQWIYTHGPKKGQSIGMEWGAMGVPWMKGDEPNVKIYLFDKTPWDIFQIYAAVCPDYIAAVHPFEFRSTLFFGKPWWGLMDRYIYQYRYDPESGLLIREPVGGYRKPYSQFKIYLSDIDIIKNEIKATSQYMYTNVIGVYNEKDKPKKTMVVQLDSDIYPDKQKTALVHIPLKASKFFNFWTQERYALSAATSALRDYVKEMYQGDLIVLGDPTTKPYDTMYIADRFTDMNGNAWVKRVVHHFSFETGFVTNISPDCISIIDDRQGISLQQWLASFAISLAGVALGRVGIKLAWKNILKSPIPHLMKKYADKSIDYIFEEIINNRLDEAIKEVENVDINKKVMQKLSELKVKRNKRARVENKIREEIKQSIAKEAKKLRGTKSVSKGTLKKWKEIIAKIGKENIDLKDVNQQIRITRELLSTTSKTYDSVVEKTIAKVVAKALEPFKEIYANPNSAGKVIEEIWEASGFLNKKHLFENKGIIRKTFNFAYRNASKIAKKGLTVGSKVTAKGLRALTVRMSAKTVANLASFGLSLYLTVITENILEMYRRYLQTRQALVLIPLRYRGKNFVAGIDGHRGSVIGDTPSKLDRFFEGHGFAGDLISVLNTWVVGTDIDYSPPTIEEVKNDIDDLW